MKRTAALTFCLLMALEMTQAQEPPIADSVNVTGTVVNFYSGKPEPLCVVKLLRDGLLVAGTVCDLDGHYRLGPLPVDTYTLNVSLNGMMLTHAELSLTENADLSIAVISDTSHQVINLREVRITSNRYVDNKLYGQGMLITNPQDPRLWDFSYRDGTQGSAPRDASASVAMPSDLHPMFGDAPQSLPSYLPKKAVEIYMTGHIQYLTPPIWELAPDAVYAIPTPQIAHQYGGYQLVPGILFVPKSTPDDKKD